MRSSSARWGPLAVLSRHRALCCLLVVVVLAGCGGILEEEPALANGEEAAERFESLDSYNATVTLEFREGDDVTTWTGQQVVAPGQNQFYERLSGPNGTEVTVSDGQHTWLYNPEDKRAQKLTHGGVDESLSTEIRALVAAAHADEAAESGGSVRLLPFVPQFRQNADAAAAETGDRRVTHEGTETIAGRETHVIAVEYVDGDVSTRHYLDTEYYVPLKTTGTFESDGTTISYTLTYEEVEFEPDLPPDLFEFTPPEKTSVRKTPFEEDGYGTPAALEEVASMSVPRPSVPPEFSLASAERFAPGAETVELTYTSERGELTVAKTNVTLQTTTPDEQVDIGGQTAGYTEKDDYNSVTWTCEGNYYSVRGEFDRELLIEVASSITCA
jgi:outer membrane lipoprotein-sorting protein